MFRLKAAQDLFDLDVKLMKVICTICMLSLIVIGACQKRGYRISDWFDEGAANCNINRDLHHCSQWKYLSESQFKDIVLNSLSKLDPPLKDGDSIFDLGMGVGAVFQVIRKEMPHVKISGSDIASNAIEVAKEVFPKDRAHFYHHDMTLKHDMIPDNSFDHVTSFGALAMYLTKDKMLDAIKEAIRITKPGGSLLITSFIEPGGTMVGSIVDKVERSFWAKTLPAFGAKNIRTYAMKHQGDRYQLAFTKK